MNEKDILTRMRSEEFINNNGVVLRAVNIGRTKFNKLSQLCAALEPDIDEAGFTDCINYLSLAGYIDLRRCSDKQPTTLADDELDDIEAKVSAEGIRLLSGKISDDCVRT